ncbi:hypothetical protein BGZ82_002040 [Podila clonocystis]|nr:hypothetical protein BGZ82_002040 [Podila clonocystis]
MFDITELDHIVCSQLELGTQAKCAQVSKKWNKVLAPYVWRTIPEETKQRDWCEVCQLVLEDLLQERQHALQEQSPRTRQSTRTVKAARETPESHKNTRPPPSPLTKNGHLVHQVQCAAQVLTGLERILDWRGPYKSTGHSDLTAQDLVRHLLKCCPNALMTFEMTNEHFNAPQKYRLALEILPRVNTLVVSAIYDGRKVFPVAKLKQVLTTTSNHLESLSINTPSFRAYRGDPNGAKSSKNPEPRMTSRPKKLKLQALGKSDSYAWLWHACGHVQELEVEILANKVYTELVHAAQHSMPSLDTVTFSNYVRGGDYEVSDQQIASLLTSGTKSWKAVHFGTVARVGVQAMNAVLKHAATLEEFSVARVQGSPRLARVLQSCPKLRVFEAMAATEHDSSSAPKVPATDLIDWDQEAKALRRWRCKTRLETLAVRITDFPLQVRSLQGDRQAGDQHFVEIQQRVFQRLGGFRNLKVLQLGHSADMGMKQFNCATLEYGLDKMRGLKNLEELHIDNMDHRVTEVEEIEWMVKRWPKLRKVSGLDQKSNAYKWLKRHHPEIQQQTSN